MIFVCHKHNVQQNISMIGQYNLCAYKNDDDFQGQISRTILYHVSFDCFILIFGCANFYLLSLISANKKSTVIFIFPYAHTKIGCNSRNLTGCLPFWVALVCFIQRCGWGYTHIGCVHTVNPQLISITILILNCGT